MKGERRRAKVGAYLRLSREDGDKAESDSIANQRKILTSYCRSHPELELVDFYIDDGCTGTHFDRPAFRQMERDWERGHIDCVLVKDLSPVWPGLHRGGPVSGAGVSGAGYPVYLGGGSV